MAIFISLKIPQYYTQQGGYNFYTWKWNSSLVYPTHHKQSYALLVKGIDANYF